MDTLDELLFARTPNALHPLMGVTVLLVEDSRYACEAVRLLCQKSGARLRRAGSIAHAKLHLRTYRPRVVIIDLGLPDGNGESLIRELARAPQRVDVILGFSGDLDGEIRSVSAGADGYLAKPVDSLGGFQHAILSQLPAAERPRGPRPMPEGDISPDRLALTDDLTLAADALRSSDDDRLGYVAQFLGSVASSADDPALFRAVSELAALHTQRKPVKEQVRHLTRMVQERIEGARRTGLH